MNQIFVDTSAWDAIADKGDEYHVEALRYRDEITDAYRLLTSNYVLDELYTLLLMNIGYRNTIAFKRKLDTLTHARILEVAWIDQELANAGWEIFAHFNVDKQWSYTDCTSYAVMKACGISESFAFDHHFEQMGFIRRPDTRLQV